MFHFSKMFEAASTAKAPGTTCSKKVSSIPYISKEHTTSSLTSDKSSFDTAQSKVTTPDAPSSKQPTGEKTSEVQVPSSPIHETETPDDMSTLELELDGMRNFKTVLLKLNHQAPLITIYVGPSRKEFVISKALLFFHCPSLKSLLGKKNQSCSALTLPKGDPQAFEHIVWRMTQSEPKMRVGDTYIDRNCNDNDGPVEACTVLCRIWYLAVESIDMEELEDEVLGELRIIIEKNREFKMPTPITSELVMEVWQRLGEDSPLWRFLLKEIGTAFSDGPYPEYDDFEQCFRSITSFDKHILELCIARSRSVAERNESPKSKASTILHKTTPRASLSRKIIPLIQVTPANCREIGSNNGSSKKQINGDDDNESETEQESPKPRYNAHGKKSFPASMRTKFGDNGATMKVNKNVENSDNEGNMSETLKGTPDELGSIIRKRLPDEESDDSDSDAQTEILSPKRVRIQTV